MSNTHELWGQIGATFYLTPEEAGILLAQSSETGPLFSRLVQERRYAVGDQFYIPVFNPPMDKGRSVDKDIFINLNGESEPQDNYTGPLPEPLRKVWCRLGIVIRPDDGHLEILKQQGPAASNLIYDMVRNNQYCVRGSCLFESEIVAEDYVCPEESMYIDYEEKGDSIAMKQITPDELRGMRNSEGLIFQGCGGDPREWLDGINEMFTAEGILLDGDTFKDVSSFEYGGLTNLLFSMDDVKLDVGKLAMWRLVSQSTFGGTWLSDFVENRLGGFAEPQQQQEKQKPDCPIIGADGNIFNLMGIAGRTLKDHGMRTEAAEMRDRITSGGSYAEALGIIGEYVNITAINGCDSQTEGEEFCMEELT